MKIQYVYLAGPYTKPNPNFNVNEAVRYATVLRNLGFVVFVPHLCHLWDMIQPADYRVWMKYDLAWLEKCDALLRIPGESSGADEEVDWMTKMGRPVFFSVDELQEYNRTAE